MEPSSVVTDAVPWSQFDAAEPELARAVQGRFAAHLHHVLGTVRREGGPRLSGTEVNIVGGELWLGMMPGSRKALDLRRDPRWALHSAPVETDLAAGDAKLSGRAVEVTDPDEVEARLRAAGQEVPASEALLFHLLVAEAVLTRVQGDQLVIDWWRPGGPARRLSRT